MSPESSKRAWHKASIAVSLSVDVEFSTTQSFFSFQRSFVSFCLAPFPNSKFFSLCCDKQPHVKNQEHHPFVPAFVSRQVQCYSVFEQRCHDDQIRILATHVGVLFATGLRKKIRCFWEAQKNKKHRDNGNIQYFSSYWKTHDPTVWQRFPHFGNTSVMPNHDWPYLFWAPFLTKNY